MNISGTFANPYYLATEAKYYFLSASYKIKNYGVIGFSRDYLKLADIIVTNEFGVQTGEFPLSLRNYRLTLASQIIPDLFIGANINLFRPYDLSEFSTPRIEIDELFYFDFGILKTFNISAKRNVHSINIGSSVINLNSAKLTYENPLQIARLPVIFRIGASYNLAIDDRKVVPNLKTYNLLFVTEYQAFQFGLF